MHGVVERPSIRHIKREKARVVVVKPHAARARALQQRAQLGRSKAVNEIDVRLFVCIFKANHRSLRVGRRRLSNLRAQRSRRRERIALSGRFAQRQSRPRQIKEESASLFQRPPGGLCCAAARQDPRALSCAAARRARDSPPRAPAPCGNPRKCAAPRREPRTSHAPAATPRLSHPTAQTELAVSPGTFTKNEPSCSTGAVPIATALPVGVLHLNAHRCGRSFHCPVARKARIQRQQICIVPWVQPRRMPIRRCARRNQNGLDEILIRSRPARSPAPRPRAPQLDCVNALVPVRHATQQPCARSRLRDRARVLRVRREISALHAPAAK